MNTLYMQFEAQDVMVPWHLQPKYVAGTCQDQTTTSTRRSRNNEKVRERKRLKKEQKKLRKAQAAAQESTEFKSEDDEPRWLLDELSAIDLDEIGTSHDKTDEGLSEPDTNDMLFNTEALCSDVDTVPNKVEIMTRDSPKTTSPQNDDNSASNLVVATKGYQTFQRYYHVFRRGELVQLFSKCSDVVVLEEFYDHENWCVIGKKI